MGPNKAIKVVLHFPHFNRHASITPKQGNYDAEDAHGEENSAVHH
jgi:hypothetical protein